MLITKVVAGPTYDPTDKWCLRIGEIEKVTGAAVNAIASCEIVPVVTGVSGNIVKVEFVSGNITSVSAYILTSTNFFVQAEGY